MKQSALVLVFVSLGAVWAANIEEEAKEFIYKVNEDAKNLAIKLSPASWAAATADSAHRERAQQESDEADKKWNAFLKTSYNKLMTFPWKTFKNQNLKRLFFVESFLGELALSDDKQAQLKKIQQDMNNLDITTLVDKYKSTGSKVKLNYTEMDNIILKDYLNVDEMNFYWKEWHDAVGKPMKDLFPQWLALEQETAHLNGYSDISRYWEAQYEIDDFEHSIHQLYEQVEPLFKELHAYIRYKLWIANGKNDQIVDPKGPISASLLGWSWGLDADGLYDFLVPYPQKPKINITQALVDKGFKGRKVVETANNYFESMGFSNLPPDFWKYSIFEKKGDASCYPASYDYSDGHDYRITYCAEPTTFDFTLAHQTVGFTEYLIAYKDQPYFYQSIPNSAIWNAYGLLLEQLAGSPNYYKSLDLLDQNYQLDKELEINTLMDIALNEVIFLPFGYAFDLWRWRVTQGKIAPEHYNCEYWKLRESLQGVVPPVERDESILDVAEIVWFTSGGQYMLYYLGDFIRYNMMSGLCKAAGYYDPKNKPDNPLVFCDIHNSKAAGDKLRDFMSVGDSKPWEEPMEKITGKKKLDASGLLEFFQPLYGWVKEENKKNNVKPGWTAGPKRCH